MSLNKGLSSLPPATQAGVDITLKTSIFTKRNNLPHLLVSEPQKFTFTGRVAIQAHILRAVETTSEVPPVAAAVRAKDSLHY